MSRFQGSFSYERIHHLMVKLLSIAWMRIRTNMRNPIHRKNVAYFMAGKLLGLSLVLTAMWGVSPCCGSCVNTGRTY